MTLPSFSSSLCVATLVLLAASNMSKTLAFLAPATTRPAAVVLFQSIAPTETNSFIDTELRGAAMRLHTREQAPNEGQAPSKPQRQQEREYVTTHMDYLRFLVDSQHVYKAFEDVVNARDELAAFRNTGLERVEPLETDIEFIQKEYNLERPSVGKAGLAYAEHLRSIESVPEFVCHFYNWYFAHTAGGRMIGKQMSALLLDRKTLEFYKWDGDLNEIKARTKGTIEDMAASWSQDQRATCVNATADTFRYAGAINQYLAGQE